MTAGERVAACAGRGPFARWAGRRLFAAAERGDAAARADVAQVARTPEHRLCERARSAVAVWWVKDRDPFLRQVVLDVGAVAAGEWRLPTLALLGRLAAELEPRDAVKVPPLFADADPDVREQAAAACREASGPLLEALWVQAAVRRTWPLREPLLANAEAPPPHVVDGLWADFLGRPPEPLLLDALVRWGRPASYGRDEALSVVVLETDPGVLTRRPYRDALIEALGFGDGPLSEIAERKALALGNEELTEEICAKAMSGSPGLAWFCRKHKVAPKDQVKRALFFLMTGQREQYLDLDPDGSLLSLAYASASAGERAEIQDFMLTAGELDLVRVIVGDDRRARIPSLSPEEVEYLAEELAARREWEDLWAIVQDVPIGIGVGLFRLFDGWVPRDDDTRRIFEMYLETDPSAVADLLGHLPDGRPHLIRQARFLFHGRVNDVSFAPEGPFLAAAGTNRVAGVFDLRTAQLVERYGGFATSVGRVLCTGDGVLIAGERTNRVDRECRVLRCADGATRTLHKTPGSITSLALRSEDGGFVAGTRAGNLLLGDPGGHVESRPVRALRLGGRWPRSVAAHPASGRIAVLGKLLVVADAAAGNPVVARTEPPTARAVFVDADTLVCADLAGQVTRLRRSGHRFEETGQAQVGGLGGLAAPPGTGEPMVMDRRGDLYAIDPETAAATIVYRAPEAQNPTSLTVSPSGDFLAVGDAAGHTDLFDLRVRDLPHVVRRPVVDLVPRHLGIVGTALADTALSAPAGAALRLLHACLEHRFRFDVEIGDAVRLTAGEHDISL